MPYARNDDIDIYYEQHGDSGPPLVFAHGAGRQRHQLVAAGAGIRRLPSRGGLRPSRLRPHALSAGAAESAAHFEADLMAVMDAAELDRAVIVCQSMGGWTGVRAAVQHTSRVRAVLLANTPGAIRTAVTVANMEQLAERLAEAGGLGESRLQPGVCTPQSCRRVAVSANCRLQHTGAAQHSRRIRVRCACGGESDRRRAVPHAGERSGSAVSTRGAGIGGRRHRRSVTRIDGAGHSTYFEKPDEFNAVLAAFLDSLGWA